MRIYPVPFRLLDSAKQFPKWAWVQLDVRRREKDRRPESFSPCDRENIQIGDHIPAGENGWRERRRFILERGRVSTSLAQIIQAARHNEASLATFRPARMIGMDIEKSAPEWDARQLARAKEQLRQGALLGEEAFHESFRIARKVPYDFFYRFRDEDGQEARLRILDWEIGMLYFNCLNSSNGNEQEAVAKVRQKYETQFFQTDLHLFLGTTYEWHQRAPNPWVIVGVFPPPPVRQLELF